MKDIKELIKPITNEQKELDRLEKEKQELEYKSTRITSILEFANIPKRYENAKPEPINDYQIKLVDKMKQCFAKKKITEMSDLLILGSVGTGKTHLSIGLINNIIHKALIYCRYVTEFELLELYTQKRFDAFNGFKKVDILVLDEIGKRELQDWQKIQLEELISYRYNELLPTIYISNLETDEFKQFLGDRVTDRLKDNKISRVTLNSESLRGKI